MNNTARIMERRKRRQEKKKKKKKKEKKEEKIKGVNEFWDSEKRLQDFAAKMRWEERHSPGWRRSQAKDEERERLSGRCGRGGGVR
ncbi:protein MNN4-like [Callorhinchus milii]|uniref:protein MNN4-like n=1 Tax=Callorhinchus milii TaxID=7868 RepID=UPI0004572B93|nr:protein MNN4-like [Callorhinchus milii]|eukprot:gi/632962369/ref/XP_007897276.1/ PREDICTED: protein MNN4-like [Callorhinchus milii]